MENWKRILIAFLPLLQHSITPLLHKEALNVEYKEDVAWQTKLSFTANPVDPTLTKPGRLTETTPLT
jgi:hypothetical protein